MANIIKEDLNKFSTPAGMERVLRAKEDVSNGKIYFYENASEELKNAKKLPGGSAAQREIRSDAIKNARIKKRSAALVRKYGIDNIKEPSEYIKEEIINRDSESFFESLKNKRELNAYLKAESVYSAVIKPYNDAQNIISQAEFYTNYNELEERYFKLMSAKTEY